MLAVLFFLVRIINYLLRIAGFTRLSRDNLLSVCADTEDDT